MGLSQADVSGWTSSGRYNLRVRALILYGGAITLAISAAWSAFYAGYGFLFHSFWTFLAALSGAVTMFLAWRYRLREAAIVLSHAGLLTTLIGCFFDVPPEGLGRAVHFNLFPIVAATFLVFSHEGVYLRVLLPLFGVLSFLIVSLGLAPLPPHEFVSPVAGLPVVIGLHTITGIVGLCIVVIALQTSVSARHAMEGEIRKAIARGEFYLQYQPQVDASGRTLGAEALLRWKHGKKGNISPGAFIPLAEETGLIIPIGEWVLRTACAQLAAWAASPLTAQLTVSVNVSASQFRQPDFVEQVRSIVRLSGARPELLKLELTESALAEDAEIVGSKMQALKEQGISWSLDDFGTGYSSLSSLKQLPFDQLKIDQSFVRDLLNDDRNLAIVSTILQLGQSLGLEIIAEGVETQAQFDLLQAAGCSSFQGYLFSRPVSAARLADFVEQGPAGLRATAPDFAPMRAAELATT